MIKQLIILVGKDFSLEMKRPYLLNGMLLYMISTVFVCYLAFDGIIDNKTWNALYWIILLFASVNSAGRSFSEEFSKRHLYYYLLADPASVILAKMCYNAVLLMILSLLGFLAFSVFMGTMAVSITMFLVAAIAGSAGLAMLLTLVAGIASRGEQNFTLMAILSFPIVLPKLLILMKLSHNALNQAVWADVLKPLFALFALQMLIVILSVVLFPYLWKE